VTILVKALAAALADRYRIEVGADGLPPLLGQGGMATVYLAQDLKHDRKVAIKVLRPELAAVIGAERFLREIKTIANLQHPHILGLIDSGEVNGTAYYVMPFVEGESLRDRLNREKQLPINDAVRVASEVAAALDYAHRHGVIHRDIKPENVMLHDGSALVADFGIALAVSSAGGSRMTETGMSLGTPHYMSPEQAMGEREITARSDVYALGAMTYEMLLGEPPFTGPTAQAIVAKVMTEKPAPLRLRRDTIPDGVEHAVLTALQKLPADRFRTTVEFSSALAAPTLVFSGSTRSRAGAVRPGAFVLSEATCHRLSRAGFDPRLIGTELHYLDNGVPSPVLVCCIPAWGRGSDQNIEMLSRVAYRAVVPTFRGFEPVTPWRPTLSIEDHIVLVREFLHDLAARLEPRLIVLAGFSTGADIALRFAATPDPDSRLRVDGSLVLGCNLASSTCFFTRALASLESDDDAAMLAAFRQVSNSATSLDEWVNICEYVIRIAATFRHEADPVRMFASGITGPFEQEELTPFANWYRAATTAGCRLRCVFEDTPMYRDLVRELQLRNLDERLLGDRYEEASVIIEAGTSHFDLVEPSRVARHLDALVARVSAGTGGNA
jgi:tRNA A-37 threonylcarbamoyl transferase component Bud32/pimeloyl-ACP methyl ester carboxylesterase